MEIPGYAIERELGAGAMATVYLATQRSLERRVALKVMAAALAADPEFCERFLREGRMLARLSQPNTVTIHDIGHVGDLYYMAMEYLPGGTLKERIARGVAPAEALDWLRQIARALGYAHAQGLVHRDVKPANILFRADGTAVLSDFGIAKSRDERTRFSQAGFSVGTPGYMSPEQARGQPLDGRADLYSLGVVFYEMLTGQPPYRGNDSLSTALAQLTEPLPELPPVHGRYQGILRGLLAREPGERFADADALLAALDRLPPPAPAEEAGATRIMPLPPALEPLASVPSAVPARGTASAASPSPRAGGRRIAGLLAAALAGLLALAGGGYWWFGRAPEAEPGAAAGPALATPASRDRPLRLEGRQSLFQRVLGKPGARLFDAPGALGEGRALPAFAVFYVYRRQTLGETLWLEVGAGNDGRRDGWLPAAQVVEWRHNLVLRFAARSGRAPALFLRDASSLERLLADPQQARAMREAARSGGAGPLLGVEPVESAVPAERFYLLPILEARAILAAGGQPAQLLRVASLDPGDTAPAGEGAAPAGAAPRLAIVLVVDTSASMRPYLERLGRLVGDLPRRLAERAGPGGVGFALVGFGGAAGADAPAQVLAALDAGGDPRRFVEATGRLAAVATDGPDGREDAFAGVMRAVGGLDWSAYDGRLILLISDAAALPGRDPQGHTGLDAAEVREAARARGIGLFALHLGGAPGTPEQALAERQYRTLSGDPDPRLGEFYVPAGAAAGAFEAAFDGLATAFAGLLQAARDGSPSPPAPAAGTDLAARSAALGRALRLAFLGRRAASRAPSLDSAWTSDRDPSDPLRPAFEVCVLVSRQQLGDFRQGLKAMVAALHQRRTTPEAFFLALAGSSARLLRDPATLGQGPLDGARLGEYLEGLPYLGTALGMTPTRWLSLSAAEQEAFVDELEAKIHLYEILLADPANWVRFGAAPADAALYRLPLSALP